MTREQREIMENYRIAIRQDLRGLDEMGKSTRFYLERLMRISTLGKNAAGRIGNLELQMRLEI